MASKNEGFRVWGSFFWRSLIEGEPRGLGSIMFGWEDKRTYDKLHAQVPCRDPFWASALAGGGGGGGGAVQLVQ